MSPQSESTRTLVSPETWEYSATERQLLLRLARDSIQSAFEDRELDLTPPSPISLNRAVLLRPCILEKSFGDALVMFLLPIRCTRLSPTPREQLPSMIPALSPSL